MFERPGSGERAVLVHLDLGSSGDEEGLQEFRLLAESAGAVPVGVIRGSRQVPDPRYFVGAGKVEEIEALAGAEQAEKSRGGIGAGYHRTRNDLLTTLKFDTCDTCTVQQDTRDRCG